ncbi:unnamed protein product [Chondrus crispus]|uniref:Pet127-domain-containing protein n=1 Tax=Chondrus crispus TaxID=2769 RepID=R7QNH1_CHOCR|nr:unnamed protein product [Chondrus crispus]CDF39338.1 unnamed protein product [Chondrus crispus]|eukprot:XP_005719249.1 unnamed protein product [Chondrus crispus]
MSGRVLSAASRSAKSSKSTNRFVRFGYRKQKQEQITLPQAAEQHGRALPQKSSIRARSDVRKHREFDWDPSLKDVRTVDYSSWPEVGNCPAQLVPVLSGQDPSIIPILKHGVEAVLRGDGVYPLEAPWIKARGVHNNGRRLRRRASHSENDQYQLYYGDSLRTIVHPDHIAWENIPEYIPAGSDTRLQQIAESTANVHFYSSTSSITPAISALYHLISNFRDTDLQGRLSSHISDLPTYFSKMHRRPVAFTVKRNSLKRRIYSVNAHSGPATGPSILRDLGHSMERMLTTSPNEFSTKYVRSPNENSSVHHDNMNESKGLASPDEQFYNYSKISKFLLRAQIDCRNENTGEVFDVKTRAVAPIRYDLQNYEAFSTHRLRFLRGKRDSYEREFYDMVRTVFLKYALQLRIGRMSGALVAYHNTSEILGLEYLPLKEINSYVFGSEKWGDIAFGTTMHLLQDVLEKITAEVCQGDPNENLKVVMSTEWSRLHMYIFVQRVVDGEQDPFGPSVFLEMGENDTSPAENVTSKQKNLSGIGQWHMDSFLHANWRGLSMLGSHPSISKLGGHMLEPVKEDAALRLAKRPRSETYDYSNYDLTSLTRDRFRVWELRVAPLVNDKMAPRNLICLGEEDRFRLKYNLKEVSDVKTEHVAKFITSLGRIYTY